MDTREKAEEFFDIIANGKKTVVEIPLYCSQGEVGTLLHLAYAKNEISPAQLAEILDVSMPRITTVLKTLENKKLIKRTTDSKDKRKTIISITDYGRKLVSNKKQEAIEKIIKIMNKLDEETINEYIRITRKIGNVMVNIQY